MNCRRTVIFAIITILALALPAATAFAQPPMGCGMGMPRYDKSAEATIAGTVDEVQSHQGRMGGAGTHLRLTTPAGPIDVHLGPTNWLASKNFTVAKGDQIEVTGSKITINGQDALIAREVKHGDATLVLRNETGVPVWSGRGGRMR